MKRIVIGACAALLLAVLSGSEANAASPIGTTVTRLGSSIIDGQDNTWTVTPNAQIALNGQVQPITQQVELVSANPLCSRNGGLYSFGHPVKKKRDIRRQFLA